MDDFGGKELVQVEVVKEGSNHRPEKMKCRQPMQRQSPVRGEEVPEAEADASNRPTMIKSQQPKPKRQKQDSNESEQQPEASNKQKRGRRAKLTEDERHANKLESGRKYRRNKAANCEALEKKNLELEKDKKRLEEKVEKLEEESAKQKSVINAQKEELAKANALANKVERKVSDISRDVNQLKRVNEVLDPGMQQLQENFLNEADQETLVPISGLKDIPFYFEELDELVLKIPGRFFEGLDSFLEGSSSGEGTSIAEKVGTRGRN